MTIVMVLSESKRNQEGCCCKIIKCYEGFVRKYCFGSVNVKLQEILIFFKVILVWFFVIFVHIRVHGFLW